MKRTSRSRLAVLLLGLLSVLLLALAACTGTTFEEPDVLLVVGYTDPALGAGGGRVALVRAESLCTGPNPICQEQALLPESVRELPAPPVANDFVERVQARSELVVLSRAGNALNAPAFLSFFTTAGLDPENPATFAPSPLEPVLELGLALPRVPALQNAEIAFCPVDVQVSATGRYAAIMNDVRGTCASPFALNSVVVLDLQPGPGLAPRIVDLFDDNVLPAGLFINQTFGGAGDRLFWVQDRGDARVLDTLLPRPAGAAPRAVAEIAGSLIDPVVDLGAVGGALIALRTRDFVPVTGLPDSPVAGEPVATALTAARRLVVQEAGQLPSLVLVGRDRVAIHLDQDDPEPAELSVPGVVGGTIDAARFAYFASLPITPGDPGAISLFDFVFFDPALGTPRLQRFPVTGLGNPVFISWVLARAEPPVAP